MIHIPAGREGKEKSVLSEGSCQMRGKADQFPGRPPSVLSEEESKSMGRAEVCV